MPRRAEAVFYHKTGDAIRDEPVGIPFAFMGRQTAVAAARQNHHRGTSGSRGISRIKSQRWDVFVLLAQRARSAIGPERDGRLGFGAKEQSHRHQESEPTARMRIHSGKKI